MSRSVYRFRKYQIAPDLRLDAEPPTFAMECMSCDASGLEAATTDSASAWIVMHLKEQPMHLRYRERITRPYRAEPRDWL